MTFSDVVAGLDTNMFQPAPVAWLWDAAGRLEINWKLSCHEKHILGDTKKWLFSVQAVFLFLIYFKQYLFAVKSKRYSTVSSSTITMYPEDHWHGPFFLQSCVYFHKIEVTSFHHLCCVFIFTCTGHCGVDKRCWSSWAIEKNI